MALHEPVEVGLLRRAARCSSIWLSSASMSFIRGHVLGRHVAHRAGHLVEVALHQLLAELVDQLLELLAGLARRELVVLEVAHLAGEVGRQQVELACCFSWTTSSVISWRRGSPDSRASRASSSRPWRSMSTTSRSSWAMSS